MTTNHTGQSAASDRPSRAAWTALATLLLVYMLNFLDRTLIFILFAPIKKELALSDLQLALLGSTSFVIFYTVLGVPFGKLADKVVRKKMIAAGLVIWSVFSGLTGWMESFTGIFLCRVMVGVGEATLGPAALSLLSDLFPTRMRATVGAIYSAGIPVGAGAALLLGGQIAQTLGWRWAFYLLGFPGLIVAIAVLMIREPARGATETPAANAGAANVDWRVLFNFPALRYHYFGYAFFALASNSLSMWIPTYLNKVFAMDLATVGLYTGLSAVVGGLIGTLFGGYGADWFKARHPGGRMRFTMLGALACIPLWLLMLNATSALFVVVPYFFLMGLALMWLGPAAADVQDVVGPKLRGLGIGVYFLVVNLIGYGLGPPALGRISDLAGVATDPSMMRYSLLLCPASCVISALLLWRGSVLMARASTGKGADAGTRTDKAPAKVAAPSRAAMRAA